MISFSQCRSIKEADLHSSNTQSTSQNNTFITSIDISSIKNQLNNSRNSIPGKYFGSLEARNLNDTINLIQTDQSYLSPPISISKSNVLINKVDDIRAYDIIKSFHNSFKNLEINDKERHYVHFKLKSFEDKRSLPLIIFTAWTLGMSSIIGIPANRYTTNIDVDIYILNKDLDVVKKYSYSAKGSAFMAVYWGYGKDMERKSNLNAFNDVFEKARLNILQDFNNY